MSASTMRRTAKGQANYPVYIAGSIMTLVMFALSLAFIAASLNAIYDFSLKDDYPVYRTTVLSYSVIADGQNAVVERDGLDLENCQGPNFPENVEFRLFLLEDLDSCEGSTTGGPVLYFWMPGNGAGYITALKVN